MYLYIYGVIPFFDQVFKHNFIDKFVLQYEKVLNRIFIFKKKKIKEKWTKKKISHLSENGGSKYVI